MFKNNGAGAKLHSPHTEDPYIVDSLFDHTNTIVDADEMTIQALEQLYIPLDAYTKVVKSRTTTNNQSQPTILHLLTTFE